MNLWHTTIHVLFFFAGSLVLHALICHLTSSKSFILKGLLVGVSATILLGVYFFKQGQINLVGLYLYFTLWLLYLMAFINLLNSATLKMLERLYHAPQGFLYAEDFKHVFNEEDGLKTRLDSMKLNHFIEGHQEILILTPKAQSLLKVIFFLRRVLSIDCVG